MPAACATIWVCGRAWSSEIGKVRPAEPRKRGAGERTWNHTVDRPNRRAPYLPPSVYPFPHSFTIATSTTIISPSCPSLSLHRRRPVALIIREYVAVMLSIPPANSNRAHPPTWWYRQEKWPHALQSQHFCVGCGRERGSSPRTRGNERERFIECLGETSLRARSATFRRRITLVSTGAGHRQSSRYVIRRKDTSLWPAVLSRWSLSTPRCARMINSVSSGS